VAAGEGLRPAALGAEERLVAQNGALAASVSLKHEPAEASRALGVVKALALPAADLDRLGADPTPRLEAWLGPRASWCEEWIGDASFHRSLYRSTLVFRAVHAGDVRAVFGQLVAIDTSGKAHLTPIVAHVEMARGHGPEARACILELDASTQEGESGARLVAQGAAELLPSPLFMVDGDARVCGTCHTPGRTMSAYEPNPPVMELEWPAEGEALAALRARALADTEALVLP